jgi:iron complex outermembrane receptor protein
MVSSQRSPKLETLVAKLKTEFTGGICFVYCILYPHSQVFLGLSGANVFIVQSVNFYQVFWGTTMQFQRKQATRHSFLAQWLTVISLSMLGSSPVWAQADDEDDDVLDVIVVTAQKREQSLIDVPLAISAIGQREIEAAGIESIADFYRRVPSTAVIDQGAARKNVIIRGIQTSTSTESSVTDVYLDEQRITTAIATGDPRIFDMNRVEVLRGPQGTLFGGGSLAGTIRYITNRANVSEFETNIAASLSSTDKADGENYSLDAMVNIPIVEDKFAIRLVGYLNEDAGYLNNTLLNLTDVGAIENSGARIGLRWKPNDPFTADYKYVYQDLKQSGFPEARGRNPDALDQASATATEEWLSNEMQMHDLTMSYDFDGFATLTSSTGYLQMDFVRHNDVSLSWARNFEGDDSITTSTLLSDYDPLLRLFIDDDNDNYTLSQELRLVSDFDDDDRFSWMAGIYYEDGEEDVAVGDFTPPGGGAFIGTFNYMGEQVDWLFKEDFTTFLTQTAVFGELTWFVTDRLQLTGGYRHSEFESNFSAFAIIGEEEDEDNPGDALIDEITTDPFPEEFDTFKFNASYSLGENSLLFIQSAEGFRLGFGSEVPPPLDPGCGGFVLDFLIENGLGDFLVDGRLPGVTSDTLWMHEIGFKGSFAEGKGVFSTGVFYGDWEDIQVEVEIDDPSGQCNTGFAANAASATSKGVEGEFSYAFTDRFMMSGSGSWVDATLDKDEPFLGAVGGERLPGSPDLQLSISGDYVWPLSNGNSTFARVDAQYIGEILGAFEFGDPRNESGKYTVVNLRAGYEAEKYSVTVFVDNALNERGNVFSNGLNNEFRRTIILRPLTVGLQFRTKF